MRLRIGPGTVFVYEGLRATRRWQLYGLRAGFVAGILAGMSLTWLDLLGGSRHDATVSIRAMASFGQSLYETIIVTELTLVLLAAPAATAGAICVDKARGALDHMLVTELSATELVLGKLAVRLASVLGLAASVIPIMALAALLGGIDPLALFGSFLAVIGCAILACSLAFLLSVWGRKPSDVLMATYLILVFWVIAMPAVYIAALALGTSPSSLIGPVLWDWLTLSNPYYVVLAPYIDPGTVSVTTCAAFLAACVGISGMLAALATLQLRAVAARQAGVRAAASGKRTAGSAPRRWRRIWSRRLPWPSVDGNPVLWREVSRSRPSRMMNAAAVLFAALGAIWFALALILRYGSPAALVLVGVLCDFQVALGLLLVSVTAATSLAEERARGSLDVLLSTPLSTRSILIAKWWGAFRSIRRVVIWAALIAGVLAIESGRWFHFAVYLALVLSYGTAIASLGLALATWVSRLGRAVALCVSVYVVFSIGWLVGIGLAISSDFWAIFLWVGSPFFGTFWAACGIATSGVSPDPTEFWSATLIWAAAYGGIAVILFAATLATFDRCLGRIAPAAQLKISIAWMKLAGKPVLSH
jgi:ABC-type transport system involved in multi-copper enzyme maturation permease subunit